MKTNLFLRFGIMVLVIAFISCEQPGQAVGCVGGDFEDCCSLNPEAAECAAFNNEKISVETDSTEAVSKLPILND